MPHCPLAFFQAAAIPWLKASGLQVLMIRWRVNPEMGHACNSSLMWGFSTHAGSWPWPPD